MFNVENVFTHFCWDNFDLNEETPTGIGTTHSTHGIAIQEHSGMKNEHPIESSSMNRSKRRSIQYTQRDLAPCFMSARSNPDIKIPENCFPYTESISKSKKLSIKDVLWILHREIAEESNKRVPGWRGWLSLVTSVQPPQYPSVVEYMRPIHHPATENATVQEAIRQSQDASQKLGQEQTIITFDLATAKKAYAIVWNSPDTFKDVFIRLGSFHIICAYFNAIGKVVEGSGFEEIVLEAGICASGSLNGVLTGKHYNRALMVHTTFLESLERLLWGKFLREKNACEKWNNVKKTLNDLQIDQHSIEVYSKDNDILMMCNDFENERSKIRKGSKGMTPQFWVQYADRVWNVLNLIKALKENNFLLYRDTLKSMLPLFFMMDHQNYARYLSVYVASLEQMDSSHPEASKHLKECALSVSRNQKKASGTSVDQTIEQTINKHAKSAAGIVGFSRNVQAYDRWCLTRHERALYVATLLDTAGMCEDGFEKCKDLSEFQVEKGMRSVKRLMQSICSFMDPFDIFEHHSLICLSSGRQVSEEIAQDVVGIDKHGEDVYEKFVKTRLCLKEISLHDPLKKQRVKTFASLKKTATIGQRFNKEVKITAQRNVYAQLLIVAEKHEIDFEKLFEYPLGPVPWALSTGDGMLAKTDKSVLLHKLEDMCTHGQIMEKACDDDIYILDGNVLIHVLTNPPETFGQLAKKLFNFLTGMSVVHFVTDTYKEISIKSSERIRRGISDKIIIKGPSTKVPRNFQKFLANDENKKQLIALIFNEWSSDSYAPLLQNKNLYFVCEEECFLLSSEDGVTTDSRPIHELRSSQEEADTRILLHAKYVNDHQLSKRVIVRSTDTDVFLLLLHFSAQFANCKNLIFDTGVGDKRRLIDINNLCLALGSTVATSLLGFHAFTGCDSTSAFVRQGKLKPFKILLKSEHFQAAFREMGIDHDLSKKNSDTLEAFTCNIYGSKASSVNKVRFLQAKLKFQSKSSGLLSAKDNADLSLLPPCQTSLNLHMQRANYQALVWKKSLQAFPELPVPENHGWKMGEGQLLIDWGDEMFPQELENILITANEGIDNEVNLEEEQATDFSDMSDDSEDDDFFNED